MTIEVRQQIMVRLRAKNQLTLPEVVVQEGDVQVGDRFFVRTDGPGRFILQRVPKSYAGSLAGLWGTAEEATAYIREMRDEWAERERRQFGE
jgi:hypothetical protein